MDELLRTDFITYLNGLRPHIIACTPVPKGSIRMEIISDSMFDIKDRDVTIKQQPGKGSVTYNNSTNKTVAVIDYEHFLNLQPHQPGCTSDKDVIKKLKLKAPDFIVYESRGTSFFFINELSQSSTSKSKRSDATNQMRNALLHFNNVPEIKLFMDRFDKKCCIFSNRAKTITMPDYANPFDLPNSFFPEPDIIPNKQINNLGFKLIETTKIDI